MTNSFRPEPTIAPAAMAFQLRHDNDDDVRCSYPGKKCLNERARKPNGTLHKLCELHRRRANLNQKRLQQKRRLLRDKLFKRTSAVRGEIIAEAKLVKPSPTSASSSPSSTSSKRATSFSPVSLDTTATFGGFPAQPMTTSVSYAAQLEYLFTDPLLQVETLLLQQQQQQPALTSEDMFMLQDVLFTDFYCYPSDLSDDVLESQLSWSAYV